MFDNPRKALREMEAELLETHRQERAARGEDPENPGDFHRMMEASEEMDDSRGIFIEKKKTGGIWLVLLLLLAAAAAAWWYLR